MNKGDIYKSNICGDFEIVEFISSLSVSIRFVKTGYMTNARAETIRKGSVFDRFSPSICGVGFIGNGKSKVNGVHLKSYKVWQSMIHRCYRKKTQDRQPSYIGCTVVKEWHSYQIFAKWFDDNYIEGMCLDKDIKQAGKKNKVYSPETCSFVTLADNTTEAHAKKYMFVSPVGEVTYIYNLSEFCVKNNLGRGNMGSVHRGERKQHKGWTKYAQ